MGSHPTLQGGSGPTCLDKTHCPAEGWASSPHSANPDRLPLPLPWAHPSTAAVRPTPTAPPDPPWHKPPMSPACPPSGPSCVQLSHKARVLASHAWCIQWAPKPRAGWRRCWAAVPGARLQGLSTPQARGLALFPGGPRLLHDLHCDPPKSLWTWSSPCPSTALPPLLCCQPQPQAAGRPPTLSLTPLPTSLPAHHPGRSPRHTPGLQPCARTPQPGSPS